MSQHNHRVNHTGLVWIIPPGTIMAYFCPPTIPLVSFLFYTFPLLCVYFFLGRKVGTWLNRLENQTPRQGQSAQSALIWYKYGFGLILLIPLVIFSASPPPSAEALEQLKVHELVSAQTAIWSIRNLFSTGLSALALSIWGRYLPSIPRQQNPEN